MAGSGGTTARSAEQPAEQAGGGRTMAAARVVRVALEPVLALQTLARAAGRLLCDALLCGGKGPPAPAANGGPSNASARLRGSAALRGKSSLPAFGVSRACFTYLQRLLRWSVPVRISQRSTILSFSMSTHMPDNGCVNSEKINLEKKPHQRLDEVSDVVAFDKKTKTFIVKRQTSIRDQTKRRRKMNCCS